MNECRNILLGKTELCDGLFVRHFRELIAWLGIMEKEEAEKETVGIFGLIFVFSVYALAMSCLSYVFYVLIETASVCNSASICLSTFHP